MPDCNENFDNEIKDGRNGRHVKCKFCTCIIMSPATATFNRHEEEFQLPLIKQDRLNSPMEAVTEPMSLFWKVDDIYSFINIAFSHAHGNTKYLACAECEAGPIGYHDIASKMSYVALSRVQYTSTAHGH